MAVASFSEVSMLLLKFQRLNCPQLSGIDGFNGDPPLMPAIFFKSRGSFRLKLLQWLFSKLGATVKEDRNGDPYATLLHVAMKHCFCSKRSYRSLELGAVLTGDAPVLKQITFLSQLLDLALDLDDSQANHSLEEFLMDDIGNLYGVQLQLEADIALDLPDKLKGVMKTHVSSKFNTEELKLKNKMLEEELKMKQAKLRASREITVPTREQFSRLSRVLVGLEEFSTRFLTAYDDRLAAWCQSDIDNHCCGSGDSVTLGPRLERIDKRLDVFAQLYTDLTVIETCSSDCVAKLEADIADLNEKLNSDRLHANFGPGDVQTINEIASKYQQATNMTSSPEENDHNLAAEDTRWRIDALDSRAIAFNLWHRMKRGTN